MVSRSRNSIIGKDLVWFVVLEDVNCLGWNSVLLHHEVLIVKINVIVTILLSSVEVLVFA